MGSETYIKGILDTVIFILTEFQPISSRGSPFRSIFRIFSIFWLKSQRVKFSTRRCRKDLT